MSSINNKSTSLSVSDIPRFSGRNFQGWSEKMIGIFMMAKVYSIVKGDTKKPAETSQPAAPTEPADISTAQDTATLNRLNALWAQYNVRMNTYNHLLTEYGRKVSNWNDANSQAMGILKPSPRNRDLGSGQSYDLQGSLGLAQNKVR